jgi:hypothetical protein
VTARASSNLPLKLAGAWTLLVAYGSLYPFAGWRDTGVDPLAFLTAGWPRYFTGFDLAAMDTAITADPDRYEKIIAGNEQDHDKSGHWGVPTYVFDNEPFFGQDRIDLLVWRMESKGLTRRK